VGNVQAIRTALFALCLVLFTTTVVLAENTITVTNDTPTRRVILLATGAGTQGMAYANPGQTVHLKNVFYLYQNLIVKIQPSDSEVGCKVDLNHEPSAWKIEPDTRKSGNKCRLVRM
jgi:hypothetical protein